MAIVKMKRLRMVAMSEDREALLRLLQRMGCVELTQPEEALEEGLSHPELAGLAAAYEERAGAERALEVLKRYKALPKAGLLEPRPGVGEGELFDQERAQSARALAGEINALDRRLAAIRAE